MSKDTQGRRRPDTCFDCLPDDIQVGDYWKSLDADGKPSTPSSLGYKDFPSNLTKTCWTVAVPNPSSKTGEGYLLANLLGHTVREHEDGTISVRPGDGSSNSILCGQGRNGATWHGYIDHGVLKEC